jgi:multiple sugar transport system permease protein
MRKNHYRKGLGKDLSTHAALITLIFFINIPILSMIGTALKPTSEAISTISLFPAPGHWSIESFITVLGGTTFSKNLFNSLIVSSAVTMVCVLISALSGYAISRFSTPFFRAFATLLLLLQIFPSVLLLLPLFIIFSRLKLTNTLWSLIICYTTSNLAFSTWMMRSFFDSIPIEMEEAGMVDGCTQFQAWHKLVLPLSMPGVSTVGIFAFINSWNEYTMASIFIKKTSLQTMTLGLQQFVQEYTSDWALLMAASTIAMLPTLFALVFAQKYLVQGMTAGAVKG